MVMTFYLNDETFVVDNNAYSVEQLLIDQQLIHRTGLALALNQEIIPRSNWAIQTISENDKILIITATQGG